MPRFSEFRWYFQKGARLNNRFCIITSNTHELRKIFKVDGTPRLFNPGKNFSNELVDVPDFETLRTLLEILRTEARCGFSVGIPKNSTKNILRNRSSFEDHYSPWLILDCDRQDSTNYKQFLNQLPTPLRTAHVLVKLGSSHALNNLGSWHLFYRLSRPITLEEKKFIAEVLGTDIKIYTPERLIFTADPTGPGAPRLGERIFYLEHTRETVDIDLLFSDQYIGLPQSLDALVSQCLLKIKTSKQGERNDTLNREAFIAAQHSSILGIDPNKYFKKFMLAGKSVGMSPSEIQTTLHSAFSKGSQNPKKIPRLREADQLLQLARTAINDKEIELFKTSDGQFFLRDNNTATSSRLSTRSGTARNWLVYKYLEKYAFGKAPPNGAVSDAMSGLIAMAERTEPPRKIYTRVAETGKEIYIHLKPGKFAKIEKNEYRITKVAPSRLAFVSSIADDNLPDPITDVAEDSLLKILFELFPDLSDTDAILIVSWLFGTLLKIPYPILFLYGARGTGKSTLAGALKILIDPRQGNTEAQLMREPKSAEDFAIGISDEHISVVDNLSYIDRELSNTFSTVCQGTVLQSRALYTDHDIARLYVHKPFIVTSIERVAVLSDLLSRAIICNLSGIKKRENSRTLESKIRSVQGRALHCLCESACDGLTYFDKMVDFASTSRLASWAQWVAAGTKGGYLGFTAKEFKLAIGVSRKENQSDAIEASPVATELIRFVHRNRGNVTDSLDNIYQKMTDSLFPIPAGWPKSALSFRNALKRIETDLEAFAGIIFSRKHTRGGNLWCIEKK